MSSRGGRPLQAVACGAEHTLALGTSGGASGVTVSMGSCGLGYSAAMQAQLAKQALYKCKEVSNPYFTRIACGAYHNLGITSSGALYTWGCGPFSGGGYEGNIPALGPVNGRAQSRETTVPSQIIDQSIDEGVLMAAGGFVHSAVLTNSRRVLTFGANDRGQLARETTGGLTDRSNGNAVDPFPRECRGLERERPHSIGTGFNITLAVGQSGNLYCAGDNTAGQCGAKQSSLANSMERVEELSNHKVHQAVGGYCHTLALTKEGRIFALGCWENGERATNEGHQNSVNEISLPQNRKPVQIAAGLNHSLALTDDGKVFGWGENTHGQLGTGTEEGPEVEPKEMKVPHRVVAISAGATHSAVLTDRGSVFTVGDGTWGQRGSQDDKSSPKPRQITCQVYD